jgi:hypothetical protein
MAVLGYAHWPSLNTVTAMPRVTYTNSTVRKLVTMYQPADRSTCEGSPNANTQSGRGGHLAIRASTARHAREQVGGAHQATTHQGARHRGFKVQRVVARVRGVGGHACEPRHQDAFVALYGKCHALHALRKPGGSAGDGARRGHSSLEGQRRRRSAHGGWGGGGGGRGSK